MKRHEVTDEQWEVLQPILPKRIALTGRRPSDPRLMLNGILWILRTGSPWRDLPERFGPWQTVDDHFATWWTMGVNDRIEHRGPCVGLSFWQPSGLSVTRNPLPPRSVMKAMSRMSPPQAGHTSGNASTIRASSLAHAIRGGVVGSFL